MTIDWKTLRDDLPADVRGRLDAKREARKLGRSLAELRKFATLTQLQLAQGAGMTQNIVSKLENADDLLLSSLLRYMQALGGSVEIILRDGKGNSRTIAMHAETARSGSDPSWTRTST